MASTPQPLAGLTICELPRNSSNDVTRVAIAFAGRLAADLGARIISVHPDGVDPLEAWQPRLRSGRSAIGSFLNQGKEISSTPPAGEAYCLTDDRRTADGWQAGSVVLTETSAGLGSNDSELTVLAASGLLDIFGDPGRPPLPTPGHQAAYSAGIAIYNALVASILGFSLSGSRMTSRVDVVDVAKWLNWKHFLAAQMGYLQNGIGRAEDWTTLRCRDGYISLVFQDRDMPAISKLVGDENLLRPEFQTLKRRRENVATFEEILSRWARSLERDEIVTRSRALKLPIGPVLSVSELLTDRQMLARDFIELDRSSSRFGMARLPALWFAAV